MITPLELQLVYRQAQVRDDARMMRVCKELESCMEALRLMKTDTHADLNAFAYCLGGNVQDPTWKAAGIQQKREMLAELIKAVSQAKVCKCDKFTPGLDQNYPNCAVCDLPKAVEAVQG